MEHEIKTRGAYRLRFKLALPVEEDEEEEAADESDDGTAVGIWAFNSLFIRGLIVTKLFQQKKNIHPIYIVVKN